MKTIQMPNPISKVKHRTSGVDKYKRSVPESTHLQICLYMLKLNGITAWRCNTGGAKYKNKDGSYRTVRYGVKGLPDIMGYTSKGQSFFWEVKKYGGKPTREQLNFLENALENNCLGGWGTSDVLEKYLKFVYKKNEKLI